MNRKFIAVLLFFMTMAGAVLLSSCNRQKSDISSGVGIGENALAEYEVAVQTGYSGTVEQWLQSLNEKSAYAIAVENGYKGSEKKWNRLLTEQQTRAIVGILGTSFSEEGEMILTLTDHSQITLGKISDEDGQNNEGITFAKMDEHNQLIIGYSTGKTICLGKIYEQLSTPER